MKSPRAYVEYARLETDPAKSVSALEHAISLNPKLAEPHWLLAQKVSDPRKRIAELHAAASASPPGNALLGNPGQHLSCGA